jgi:hypothetical protein
LESEVYDTSDGTFPIGYSINTAARRANKPLDINNKLLGEIIDAKDPQKCSIPVIGLIRNSHCEKKTKKDDK